MEKRVIAVEHHLTPVMDYLSNKGYMVESIDFSREYGKNMDKYAAIVATGMNKDFLGVQDVVTRIPVIDAKGLTAEQVYDQLSISFQH